MEKEIEPMCKARFIKYPLKFFFFFFKSTFNHIDMLFYFLIREDKLAILVTKELNTVVVGTRPFLLTLV